MILHSFFLFWRRCDSLSPSSSSWERSSSPSDDAAAEEISPISDSFRRTVVLWLGFTFFPFPIVALLFIWVDDCLMGQAYFIRCLELFFLLQAAEIKAFDDVKLLVLLLSSVCLLDCLLPKSPREYSLANSQFSLTAAAAVWVANGKWLVGPSCCTLPFFLLEANF